MKELSTVTEMGGEMKWGLPEEGQQSLAGGSDI